MLRISSNAFWESSSFCSSQVFISHIWERWKRGGGQREAESSRRIFYSCKCIASIVAYLWQIFGQLFMQCANFMQAMWYVLRWLPARSAHFSAPPPPFECSKIYVATAKRSRDQWNFLKCLRQRAKCTCPAHKCCLPPLPLPLPLPTPYSSGCGWAGRCGMPYTPTLVSWLLP